MALYSQLFVDLAVGLVLVVVIVEDLRRYRIRNSLVMILGIGFLLSCLWLDRLDRVLPHLLFALVALAILFLAFQNKLIGGGDAKLLTVCLLWIGPEGAFVFSIALFLSTLFYIGGAKLGLLPSRIRDGRTQIPFGPSIAGAWILVLGFSTYVQFTNS